MPLRPGGQPPRVATVSRGDPLTPFLNAALAERYPHVADVNVELAGVRRAVVAGLTFRPSWPAWVGSYMKSNLGFRVRSRLARRQLAASDAAFDVIVQTHALFRTDTDPTMIYVDCTYRQAMRGWPGWTPHHPRAQTQWLRIETETYRSALHLFTFTEQGRDSLITDYGIDAAKVSVVGAGVNFERTEPAGRHVDGQVILFVAKEFDRKGGAVLLEAFEIVRRQVPDARLQIVGVTPPGPVPEGVEVLGLVDGRAAMAEIYAGASVFCLPSLFDPGPMVVLEAMSQGLPCVVSRDASHHVHDLVVDGYAGRQVETGEVLGLATALIELLQDPAEAERVGANARRAMDAGYRWQHVVERMAPVIDAVREPSASGRH
jgi:starch synthase